MNGDTKKKTETETIYWGNLCPPGMSIEKRDSINEQYRARWKKIMIDDEPPTEAEAEAGKEKNI